MSLIFIGPILAIFIILIPFVKSIYRFNRFFQNTGGSLILKNGDNLYQEILDANETYNTKTEEQQIASWEFPEILFMGLAPPFGVFLIYYFYGNIQPFHIDYAPAIGIYIFAGYASYWLSRYGKQHISISLAAIISYGIIIGIILYCILFIHFISQYTLLGGAILPFFGFPLFAPLPAFLYSIRELKILNSYLQKQLNKDPNSIDQQTDNLSFVRSVLWQNNLKNWGLLITLVFTIQAVLYLFGFPFESVWLALREGGGFLFSLKNGPF